MLSYISYNRVGEPIVWDFVRNEWDYLVERFTLNDRYLGSLIPTITKKFATEMRLQEMKDFFAKYPDAGAGEANRQGWLILDLSLLLLFLNRVAHQVCDCGGNLPCNHATLFSCKIIASTEIG